MSSKATKFADAMKEFQFEARGISANVSRSGGLFVSAIEAHLPPDSALQFARWILDMFGGDGEESK